MSEVIQGVVDMKKQEAGSTEVVAQVSTAVAAPATDLNEWGMGDVSSRDVIIPKILVMQGLSDLVGEGKAKLGDFVDSITSEVLGSIDKPLSIIPLHMQKSWIISRRKKGESKFEFERYEDVTSANEGYPLEAADGDDTIKYEYALQFYVLRPEDPTLPYVVTFKSTSTRAGKALATQMYFRNKAAGLAPAAFVMELSSKKEKNDKGTFAVMEVKPKGRTSAEQEKEALNWFKVIKAGKTKVAAEPSEPAGTDSEYANKF
jgi:hypothetical protein